MAEVKPAEVSAILRQQLSGFSTKAELEETGTVLQVGDGISRVYGLDNVEAGELVEFVSTGVKGIVLNLEEDNVGVVMLGESSAINEGDLVKRTRMISSIPVSEGMMGRVINTAVKKCETQFCHLSIMPAVCFSTKSLHCNFHIFAFFITDVFEYLWHIVIECVAVTDK